MNIFFSNYVKMVEGLLALKFTLLLLRIYFNKE